MSSSALQFDREEPHDWHYLSAIPLAPGTTVRRTSFSAPRILTPAGGPPSPPRDQPDVPCTPQLDPSPVMSGGATFEVEQPRFDSPRARPRSPPRPRRPSNPDQALMFNAPWPLARGVAGSGTGEQQELSRAEPPSPRTMPPSPVFPAADLLPAIPLTRTVSPRRKPVPSYLPDTTGSSPLDLSRAGSPDSRPPSRLSLGGFEALLARRAEEARSVGDEEGRVVWSPRADLGLDPGGVAAREARRRWDEQHLGSTIDQDVADFRPPHARSQAASPGRLAPFPPAEHVHVSPRGTRARVRQTTVEDLSEPPSPATASYPRTSSRAQSAWSSRHRRFVSVDDGADAYVRAQRAGPQLRRGSKRLSEVPSFAGDAHAGADEPYLSERARLDSIASTSAAAGSQRRPSTRIAGRLLSQPSTATSRSVLRRGDARFGGGSGKKTRAVSEGGDGSGDGSGDGGATGAGRFDVVVLDPRGEKEVAGAPGGGWECLKTETTCRPERMDWSRCDFAGRFPRLLYLLYPLAVFAHVPATLFLDFALIYVLCQLALYPSIPSPTSRNIAVRALVSVPSIEPSTGWWVAVAVYSACTAAWFFGVLLYKEIGRDYYKRWKSGDRSVEIEKVYGGAASYNLACLRSYSHFSFFWRIRLAPFARSSTIAQAVEGTTWRDGVTESAAWYRQNWPTVLLVLPRAGLTVAVFLLFSTTAYGTSTGTTARDSSYFDGDGTLSRFAAGVLLANAAWAAWRLVVLLVAAAASSMPRLSTVLTRRRRAELSFSVDQSAAPSLSSRRPSVIYATWRTRRQRRIRTAILVCLGPTPLGDRTLSAEVSPVLAKSPYVTGYGTEKASQAHGGGRFKNDATILRIEHDTPARRGSAPVLRGDGTPPQHDSPLLAYRQARAPTQPKQADGSPSPLIHFSPATPSPPRWQISPRTGVQTTCVQPRRATVALGSDDPASGDVGDSILHRRMRSLQHDNDKGFLVFPSTNSDLSPRSMPLRASVGETEPRSLLPTIMASPRPPLVSRFSALSSPYASTAASSPREERGPLGEASSRDTPSSSSSFGPELASADGHASFVTAPAGAGRPSLDDTRWSHVSSTGEHSGTHSDELTVRGGIAHERRPDLASSSSVAVPVLAMHLGTPPAERDEEVDSLGQSTPEREDGQPQTLVPLRLSRASGAASFDLSAYNSPDLTGGDDSGQFDRSSPAMQRGSAL